VKLWNNIDSELELNMDVIDDFFGINSYLLRRLQDQGLNDEVLAT